MGSIKLPHASGNSMSIAAPATNPASDLELKLPATIGTAGQYLRNSSTAGTLEFGALPTDANDYVKLQTVTGGSTINDITVDSLNTTTYRAFQLIGGIIPGVDGAHLKFYWRVDGTDQTASSYDFGLMYSFPTDDHYSFSENGQSNLTILENAGNAAREGHRFNILMFPYVSGHASQTGNFLTWQGMRVDQNHNFRSVAGTGLYDEDNIYPNGFKLVTSSGQMNDYNYSLYGIKA